MPTAGYGLFRGLNEAYNAYRSRESDIQAEEQRNKEQAYRDEQRQRETEEYEYQKGLRPMQEESMKLGLDTQRTQAKDTEMSFKEKWDPAAVERRKQAAIMENKRLALDLQKSGIQLNEVQFAQDERKLRTYYDDLARKWEKGMSLDELVRSFNEEDDIESNNIKEAKKQADGSYTVAYEDGRTETYEDRDDVLKTLYMMGDTAFAKNVLLTESKNRATLAAKLADLQNDTVKDFNARGQKFSDDARAEVQALYGKIFPNGLVDFGEEGNKALSGEIRSLAMTLGRLYGYDLTKTSAAELVTAIGREAERTMDTSPETREKRALERYEVLGVPDVQDLLGDDSIDSVPKKGDPLYEALIKQLKYEQAQGDVNALRDAVYRKFAIVDGQGQLLPKQTLGSDQGKSEGTIPSAGLDGSGPTGPEGGDPTALGEAVNLIEGGGKTPVSKGQMGRDSAEKAQAEHQKKQGVLTMQQQKREQYGIKTDRRGNLKKVTAAQKKKINQDFDTFLKMPPEQQAKWYEIYGKHLTADNQQVAKNVINQATAGTNYGLL